MSIVDDVRKKLDMDNPKDVEAWESLNQVQGTSQAELVSEMIEDMRKELIELNAQVETMEKLRIRNLFSDNDLSKQAEDALKILRSERDGLKQTLQSETYKGVGGGTRSNSLETRGRS